MSTKDAFRKHLLVSRGDFDRYLSNALAPHMKSIQSCGLSGSVSARSSTADSSHVKAVHARRESTPLFYEDLDNAATHCREHEQTKSLSKSKTLAEWKKAKDEIAREKNEEKV